MRGDDARGQESLDEQWIEQDGRIGAADKNRLGFVSGFSAVSVSSAAELSLTGYSRALAATDAVDAMSSELAPLAEISRRKNILISIGAPLRSPAGLLISTVSFLPDGSISVYTKQHLHSGEEATFAAGAGGALLPRNLVRALWLNRVPVRSRSLVSRRAHLSMRPADHAIGTWSFRRW